MALASYNAIRGVAVGGFQALLPMYMASLGYKMKDIGGSVAVASAAVALLLPLTGLLIDTLGSRPVIIAAGALLAAASLAAMTSTGITLLTVAYALFLASFLVGQPARMAFLARSVPRGRLGSYIGATSVAFSASRLAGPTLAGLVAEHVGYRQAFAGVAAVALAGLAVFWALSTKPPIEGPRRRRISASEAYRRALRPPPGLAGVIGFAAIDRLGWSLWFPALTAYLYKRGFTESEAGLVSSVIGAANTALLALSGRAVDRLGSWAGIAASEALGITGVALFAGASTLPGAALAAAVIGASVSLWIPAYNSLVAKLVEPERLGEAYSSANSARALAGAPAPYLGGLAYDAAGPAAPFEASGAVMAVSLALAVALLRRVEAAAPARKARAAHAGAGVGVAAGAAIPGRG